jgi:hypothetical protein
MREFSGKKGEVEETRRIKKHLSKQRRSKRKEKRRITRGGRRKRSRHGILPRWNSGRESGLKCRSPRVLEFLCIYAR